MIKLFKYKVPFKTPFGNRSFHYKDRSGIIISYTTKQATAYGEIAPLPYFSIESLKQCQIYIKNHLSLIEKYIIYHLQHGGFPSINTPYPSVNFGLSTLIVDALSKHEPKKYQQLLPKKFLSKILLNATIATSNPDDIYQQAILKAKQGFKHIKLKCGFFAQNLPDILYNLIKKNPQVQWRLDANQQWDFNLSKMILTQIPSQKIEYCEEPLTLKELHLLPCLKKNVPIPIAGDESLHGETIPPPSSPLNEFEVVIIKPMFIGNYTTIQKWIQWAMKNKKKVIFTTALEGFIGRMATVKLTSWLCPDYTIAHGLATKAHLKWDYTLNQEKIDHNKLICPCHKHFIPPFELNKNQLIPF